MKTLVFFLEEPSAEEMLKGLLPRILPDTIATDFKVFEGKQDLEKRLPRILRAWRKPDCLFLVMRDQDSGACREIKGKLVELCRKAGKPDTVVRIACHELETFYLGDLAAVEQGLGFTGVRAHQDNKKFRDPDSLSNPAEELFKLTKNIYDKVSGSRAIGPHLNLNANRSASFTALVCAIKKFRRSCVIFNPGHCSHFFSSPGTG